ncbi:MAG: CPBP family intramembrane glutamic endopeptidase [Pseudomonadota bacterium]
MSYEPHEQLVAPARNASELWRVCAGAPLIFFAYGLLAFAYFEALRALAGPMGDRLVISAIDGETPLDMGILLLSFATLTAALALVLQGLHQRRLRSLIGSTPTAVSDGLKTLGVLALLFALIAILPPYGLGDLEPVENLEFSTWLIWLPAGLILVFIQISAEELVFRGYLQSQLAARFNSPLIWIGVPSLIFGALHYDAQAGDNAAFIALWAVAFGVAAADLTARTGTLGAAFALHFANNVAALMITGVRDTLDGLALQVYPISIDDAAISHLLWIDGALIFVSWLAIRVVLRV